jgi:hypothetical protein
MAARPTRIVADVRLWLLSTKAEGLHLPATAANTLCHQAASSASDEGLFTQVRRI